MIDLSTLQAKVGALKAQISQNSITPVYLGTILDEFIARMADLDLTDLADEMQDAIKNAADALEAATEAVATAGTASANSEDAVAKATEALAKANAAISAAQSAQTAAEAMAADLDAEAADREEADTALSGRIDSEEAKRTAADGLLSGRIDAEAAARQEADTALSGRIDAEATGRQEADTALSGRIEAEATGRQEADTALSGRIEAEATARQEADTVLMARTACIVPCDGFLGHKQTPPAPGVYIRRDGDGDPVLVVSLTGSGEAPTEEYPDRGKIYLCGGSGYVYDGLRLAALGRSLHVFDGGTPGGRSGAGVNVCAGRPATRSAILKQIDCGAPHDR